MRVLLLDCHHDPARQQHDTMGPCIGHPNGTSAVVCNIPTEGYSERYIGLRLQACPFYVLVLDRPNSSEAASRSKAHRAADGAAFADVAGNGLCGIAQTQPEN